MPTPGERRALIFLAAIAALGVAARGWRELRGPRDLPITGDRAGLARQIEAVDSAIAVGGARRRGRGAQPPDTVAIVPRPKRRTARRAAPPPVQAEPYQSPERAPSRRRAPAEEGPDRRRAPPRAADSPPPVAVRRPTSWAMRPPVDLDTATPEEIAELPAIGPALARRIVQDRIEFGPFGSIDGLERVRGISRSLARRFQPYVTFSLAPRTERLGARATPAKKRQAPQGRDARP